MIEKAFTTLCCMIVVVTRTIPRNYRISTENGWKSDLLRKAVSTQKVVVETVDSK